MIVYNVFFYFSDFLYYFYLLGVLVFVFVIVVVIVVCVLEYRVNFMFIGIVRLKYVVLFMVVIDLLFMILGNVGGYIVYLGGVLVGWWFVFGLFCGYDVMLWIN